MENGNGPAANLRKTPGRLANQVEKFGQTPKSQRTKKATGKIKKKLIKGENQPSVHEYLTTTKENAGIVKSLLEEFNQMEQLSSEEGYVTNPEIVIRRNNIRKEVKPYVQKLFISKTELRLHAEDTGSDFNKLTIKPVTIDNSQVTPGTVNNDYAIMPPSLNKHDDMSPTINTTDNRTQNVGTNRAEPVNIDDISANKQCDGLTLTEVHNECIVDECNLQIGELRVTPEKTMEFTSVKTTRTNGINPTINTTAYISASTNPTFSSAALGYLATLPTQLTVMQPQYMQLIMSTMVMPSVIVSKADTDPGEKVNQPLTMESMFSMLTHISQQVVQGNLDTRALRNDMKTYNDKVKVLQQEVEEQEVVIKDTVNHFNRCVETVDALTGVVIRQDRMIQQLMHKVENMEAKGNRNKLVISGIPETENENPLHVALAFFKTKLLIDDTITILREGV